MQKLKQVLLGLLMLCSTSLYATEPPPDEGMWLPMFIDRLNYADMQKMGLKLTAEEIYSVNRSSLKDAIVSLQFCTGSFISPEGLMLTNHHCAFSSIQFHSTVTNDYLANGFWAMNKGEEKHCPEISASILVRMDDVSAQLTGISDMNERRKKMQELSKAAEENGKFTATVKEMFEGSEYYLFVYEKFTDVRLVGAPPSSIGKFGGDTDNWMWPRHTGDFSLFRVYANKNNQPAAYSPENVPYKPKHFLPVALKPLEMNDFAMVFGFPGRTNRYRTSSQLKIALEDINPALIKIFGKRLETMKSEMDKDRKVAIQLADQYASLANSYKYYIGQTEGLEKLKVADQKKQDEQKFLSWLNEYPQRKSKYGDALASMEKSVTENKKLNLHNVFYNYALFSIPSVQYSFGFMKLYTAMKASPDKKDAWNAMAEELKNGTAEHFKDYHKPTDERLFAEMLILYTQSIDAAEQPAFFADVRKKFKGKTDEETFRKYAADAYKRSKLTSKESTDALLSNLSLKALEEDPLFSFLNKAYDHYQTNLAPKVGPMNQTEKAALKSYIAGLREFQPDRKFYPDANSTLRLTYGKVIDYSPKDGVRYLPFTTLKGVAEKEKPKDPEFDVPAKLMDLYRKKDYGVYAVNGEMPVAFLTDNDITGGNSGSPVINGKGQLIGLAFDGNWEAMTGDLVFDKQYKRTISNNINYVLFIIDKYAGAGHLVKEMKLEFQ